MEDLEVIIETILKKQSEPIANQLVNIGWLMNEFDILGKRFPEAVVPDTDGAFPLLHFHIHHVLSGAEHEA